MNRPALRFVGIAIAIAILIGVVLAFPRILAFAELASRELRYLWWLVLLLAIGIWLAFFFGKKKN